MSTPEFDKPQDKGDQFDFLVDEAANTPALRKKVRRSKQLEMPIIRKPVPVSQSGPARVGTVAVETNDVLDDDFEFLVQDQPGQKNGIPKPDPVWNEGIREFYPEAKTPFYKKWLIPILGVIIVGSMAAFFYLDSNKSGSSNQVAQSTSRPLPDADTSPTTNSDSAVTSTGSDVTSTAASNLGSADNTSVKPLSQRFADQLKELEALVAADDLDAAEQAIASMDRSVYGYGAPEFTAIEKQIAGLRAGSLANELPGSGTVAEAESAVAAARAAQIAEQAEAERLAQVEREAEAARLAQAEREAEAARLAQAEREAEAARVAQAERESEAARLAQAERESEAARVAQAEREAEAARVAQAEREAEAARVAQAEREAEAARVAQAEREAEAARVAQAEREAEAARVAQAEREAEAARVAQAEREAEAARVAQAEREAEAARVAQAQKEAEAAQAALVEREAEARIAQAEKEAEAERQAQAQRRIEQRNAVAAERAAQEAAALAAAQEKAANESLALARAKAAERLERERRAEQETDRRIAERARLNQERARAAEFARQQAAEQQLQRQQAAEAQAKLQITPAREIYSITDTDFNFVGEKFVELKNAIEGRDISGVISLTQRSGPRVQQMLQLFENHSSVKARIDNVASRNAEGVIVGTLKIQKLVKNSGVEVNAPSNLSSITLTSRRGPSGWSTIAW